MTATPSSNTLIAAVESGDPDTPAACRRARQCLRQPWSLRVRNRALLTAIAVRRPWWVRWLVPIADPRQRQALHAAIAAADPEILKIILKAIPDYQHAASALAWAARDQQPRSAAIMRLLLPHADIIQAWRHAMTARDRTALDRLLPYTPPATVARSIRRLGRSAGPSEASLAAHISASVRRLRRLRHATPAPTRSPRPPL